MRFNCSLDPTKGRVDSHVRHAGDLLFPDINDDGVHAIGQQQVRTWPQVRRRKPNAPTSLKTFFHTATHRVQTAQEPRSLAHLASAEKGTHSSAADLTPINHHRTDYFHVEPRHLSKMH